MCRTSFFIGDWLKDPSLVNYTPFDLNKEIQDYAESILKINGMSDQIRLRNILIFTCEYLEVPMRKVISIARQMEYVLARQLYSFFAFEYTNNSYRAIGEPVKRKHCTIIHEIKALRMSTYSNTPLKEIYPDFLHNFKLKFKCDDTLNTKEVFEECTKGKNLQIYDKKVYISSLAKDISDEFITIRHVYR